MTTTLDAIPTDSPVKYIKPYTTPPLYVVILKPLAFKTAMEDLGVDSVPKKRDGVNYGVSELGAKWFKNMYYPKALIPLAKEGIAAGVIAVMTYAEMVAAGHFVRSEGLEASG